MAEIAVVSHRFRIARKPTSGRSPYCTDRQILQLQSLRAAAQKYAAPTHVPHPQEVLGKQYAFSEYFGDWCDVVGSGTTAWQDNVRFIPNHFSQAQQIGVERQSIVRILSGDRS